VWCSSGESSSSIPESGAQQRVDPLHDRRHARQHERSDKRFAPRRKRLMMVVLSLGAMIAQRERGETCRRRTSVSPFSRTCPDGGTGRRARLTRVRRQRRAGSNPASGTPSTQNLTRRAERDIVPSRVRCARQLRPAREPASELARGFSIFGRSRLVRGSNHARELQVRRSTAPRSALRSSPHSAAPHAAGFRGTASARPRRRAGPPARRDSRTPRARRSRRSRRRSPP
jgi:hypothetical protein